MIDDPDALSTNDPDDQEDIYAGLPWNHAARFCGIPGLVFYSKVEKVRGDQLRIGQWLDTLDHRGARAIFGLFAGAAPPDCGTPDPEHLQRLDCTDVDSGLITVMVGFGETETVRADVEYDVVDPDTQVTPDGTPVVDEDLSNLT
jgi:hypothetical protein